MEVFGFKGRLTSHDWFSRVHLDDAEDYRDALRECFRGMTAKVACEYRIKARDGNYQWVEDRGLPIRDAAGRATRLVGCVSDVTKRRSMEEALRNSEQRYATAMEAINEAVYEWDIATGKMYYSPRLYDLIALTPRCVSFNHVAGERDERRWNVEAGLFGSLQLRYRRLRRRHFRTSGHVTAMSTSPMS
jgi:PAS domain S-box-containing protein